MTYKVTQFVYEYNNNTKLNVRKYLTVDTDMDWDTAKSLRKALRGSFVVRQI